MGTSKKKIVDAPQESVIVPIESRRTASMHTPVFADAVMVALDVKQGKKYIDATAGEGGHLKKIVDLGGQVLALDRDSSQIEKLRGKPEFEKVIFEISDFADISEVASKHKFVPVDGIIFDFGLSMGQIRGSARGFSTEVASESLDMRLDTNQSLKASDFVNSSSFEDLSDLLAKYSEVPQAADIARAIVSNRHIRRIETVGDLIGVMSTIEVGSRLGVQRRIFQALRIAVNGDLESIAAGIKGAISILSTDGVIVTISFHSLEDRVVKQLVRKNGLTTQVLKPKSSAVRKFERSAILRIIKH